MKATSLNSDRVQLKFRLLVMSLIIILLFLGKINSVNAQVSGKERPKLGLVLSGGGAKGFAHIGAIRVFEEAGLHFDYIGGTSMGSIIGGLYALNYHPDTMAKIVGRQNWNTLMADKIPRRFIPIEEKINADRFVATFPIKRRKLQMRQGLYNGQLIESLLAHYTSQSYKYDSFKDFPLPFICIGTDLEDGSSVLLDKGVFHKALRASMSIPSYFTPVHFNDRLLVDGGVVNNYPVRDVRAMGADVIVGVDVQTGLHHPEQLNSLVKIIDQVTAFYRMEANKLGVEQTDIYIKPELGNFDVMSFEYYDSIISLGEIAARKMLPQLKRLADSLEQLGPGPERQLNGRPLDSVFVSSVQYR